MAKRRKRLQNQPASRHNSEAAGNLDSPGQGQVEAASFRMQVVVSALVVFHFVALIHGLLANLAPSYLQGQISGWLAFYSVTTGQVYEGAPLELTHAEPIDFPLLLELHETGKPEQDWRLGALPGAAIAATGALDLKRSRWPNFSRIIRLIALDDPESEMLSEVAAQAVIAMEKEEKRQFDGVRLVAPKVLSFDEDAIVAAGQESFIQDELSREILYRARIVRDGDQRLQLIPAQDPARTSRPLLPESGLP